MITKKLAPLIAIALVVLFLLPGYVSAAGTTMASATISLPGEHLATADEDANIANDSSHTNHGTWNPTSTGVWVGSSTTESLFQINSVTSPQSYFSVTSEFKFSSYQIMSGASKFVVRSPFFIEPGMYNASLLIYRIGATTTYHFNDPGTFDPDPFGMEGVSGVGSITLVYRENIDLTDVSVADGNNQWVRDNRSYVLVTAPLYPDVRYIMRFGCYYLEDMSFKTYMSQDDIAVDRISNSYVNCFIQLNPIDHTWLSQNLSLDLGWSFDFRYGLGGRACSFTYYLAKGAQVQFFVYNPDWSLLNGYHSIAIPFYTANATARFSLSVKETAGPFTWTAAAYTYKDYVLAGSGSAMAPGGAGTQYLNVTITSEWAQQVTFYFQDNGKGYYFDDSFTQVGGDHYLHGRMTNGEYVQFSILNEYLVSVGQVDPINALNGTGAPLNPLPQQTELRVSDSGVLASIMITTGALVAIFGGPVGWVLGAVLIGGGVAIWLNDQLQRGNNVVSDIVNGVAGWIRGAVDAAWGVLVGIGQFLWQVAESIYGFFQWLVNAILEYGSILLGLLVVGVAMLLFFYPINYEVRILESFYLMAQGRIAEGANKGYRAGKDIVGDFTGAGKKAIKFGKKTNKWYQKRKGGDEE
jgi:hypothetical protein